MPFFSPPLKCASHSDLGYCGAHKWLSEEKGMERERVGSRFKRKGSRRDSRSVIKFVETQKERQSHSQGHLEAEKGGCRTAFFVSELQFFLSSPVKLPVFTFFAPALSEVRCCVSS